MSALSRDEAWRLAWGRGGRYLERALLHEGQREASAAFDASTARRFVLCSSRRYGKSWFGCVRAVSQCIARPGIQYRYAAPTQVMARSIVWPHMGAIMATCPVDLRPKVNRSEMSWAWNNDSVLRLAGCDGQNADRLRGGELHEAFIDEAGFIDDLVSLLEDVLMPMTLTTNGRLLLASTPSVSPAHPFVAYLGRAEAEGASMRRTIYDAPHIPREKADEYIAEAGGKESPTARREYFAEVVTDEQHAIVPEFGRHKANIVQTRDVVPGSDWYVVGDFGFSDLTVILFAWYDFERAQMVIADEIRMERSTGLEVGYAVKAKEAELRIKPVARIADAPAQMLADLAHPTLGPAVPFGPPRKDDADAALNMLRMEISRERVVIDPKCKTLIAHLEYGTWNASRTSYSREAGFGHWDAIDALKYLLRSVDRRHNPHEKPNKPTNSIFVQPKRRGTGWGAPPKAGTAWR